MFDNKVVQTSHEDGTLFERSDGEQFMLYHTKKDGSAELVRITSGCEHWGVDLAVSISLKAERARQLVERWPDPVV